MKVSSRLLCAALSCVCLLVAAAPAAADNPYFRHVRRVSEKYLGAHSGDWVHCAYQTRQPHASTLECQRNVTVSATFSASLSSGGFSAASVSPTVGFSVSYSSSFGNGESWPMKPYQSGWGDMGYRYALYRVGMESRWCPLHGSCPNWTHSHLWQRAARARRHLPVLLKPEMPRALTGPRSGNPLSPGPVPPSPGRLRVPARAPLGRSAGD